MQVPQGFPKLSETEYLLLKKYEEILKEINTQINLISRKETEQIFDKHILHSLSITHYFNFQKGTKIADIGSGGGLPAIPLAIFFPEVEFTLIESIRKKTKALDTIVEKLDLKNVKILNDRSENIKERFDFVTGRAVTAFPNFYKLSKHLIASKQQNAVPNGIIYLKGGDFTEDRKQFKYAEIYPLSDIIKDDYFFTKYIIYLPVTNK
ncbi:MAG: 16S rRNA (guanine(527)-N(7))-methyltransferase RsmG [Bacteroidales bacterium]|nr:16S rRNA (guanine(527)-N(7))-methyltransferase RsmG [Bacteroidales bacterium]